MKPSQLKQIIREKVLNEIKVLPASSYGVNYADKTIPLKIDSNGELKIKTFGFKEIVIDSVNLKTLSIVRSYDTFEDFQFDYDEAEYEMPITKITFIRCPNLKKLSCVMTKITSLDLSNCPNLEEILCERNELTSLDVSNCTKLKSLGCSFNKLTSLDLSNCPNLEKLICPTNRQLTNLDISNCTKLEKLGCSISELTSLDVSNCTELKWLHCNKNQLTSLDLSNCHKLEELYCSQNQLTSLDVSNCPNLKKLSYDDNVKIIRNKPLNEIRPLAPNTYFINPEVEEFLDLDHYSLEELFSEDIIDAIYLFNWISPDQKTINKPQIQNWLNNNPDTWGGNADSVIDFLLHYNIITNKVDEIQVQPPSQKALDAVREVMKRIEFEEFGEWNHKFDDYSPPKALNFILNLNNQDIIDAITDFIKDQMVFNNYHLVRGNKEILLNFSNLNLVTKQDLLDYVKEHPKVEDFLFNMLKEFYFDELNHRLGILRLKLTQIAYDHVNEKDEDDLFWTLESLSRKQDFYPLNEYEYLDLDAIRSKLLKSDLIKEHKIHHIYTHKNTKMNSNKLRQIIRESIHDFIKEIDEAGDTAAIDAKIAKCEEAIALREKKVEMSESLEEMKDLVDSSKINELKKEIKDLQKAKAKFEKAKEKKANKGKKKEKEVVTDGENPEATMEMLDMDTEMDMDTSSNELNESFIRMQKLAGLITENFDEGLLAMDSNPSDLTFGDIKLGEMYNVVEAFGSFERGDEVEAIAVDRIVDEIRITFENTETGDTDTVLGEPSEPIGLI